MPKIKENSGLPDLTADSDEDFINADPDEGTKGSTDTSPAAEAKSQGMAGVGDTSPAGPEPQDKTGPLKNENKPPYPSTMASSGLVKVKRNDGVFFNVDPREAIRLVKTGKFEKC